MHSIQPKADLTGVALADVTGVNNLPEIIREIF